MKNLKRYLIITLLLLIYILFYSFSYANNIMSDLSNSVFRLHVIANSNSREDQNLKYLVRDGLIEYMNTFSSQINSKEEAISIANQHIDDFYDIAKKVVQENGFSYDIKISIGNFPFPTKNYGDISLPAGFYDALKVEIGEAKGQNWWCVMFPPLCFIDVSSGVVPDESKEVLKDSMDEEEFALVSESNENSEINFKFKILELFGKSGFMTAKKVDQF